MKQTTYAKMKKLMTKSFHARTPANKLEREGKERTKQGPHRKPLRHIHHSPSQLALKLLELTDAFSLRVASRRAVVCSGGSPGWVAPPTRRRRLLGGRRGGS